MSYFQADDAQLTRYSRHLLLNEWGLDAQERLATANVLIIGAGGLGCPAAHTLVAAGLGRLTLVDDDTVDASNLLRQHLHSADRIGMNKALSAQAALHAINSNCTVTPITSRLLGAMLHDAVATHDWVLDCTDNFASRQAINRACVLAGKPLISGAAIRFDGQLIVFDTRALDSPCYHCVFPENGTDEPADRCAVTGVFAPLTQQIGTLQAAAAIKLITGIGSVALGKLQLFNALDGSVHTVAVPRNEACAACSTRSQHSH
jgi:molybdopterin-synthase adenylyltransferase